MSMSAKRIDHHLNLISSQLIYQPCKVKAEMSDGPIFGTISLTLI